MDLALDVNSIDYYANKVKDMLFDKYNVVSEIIKTKKNNNVEYTSLLIGEGNIKPTIHLNSFYDKDEDIEEVADTINDLLDKEKDSDYVASMKTLVDGFNDYNNVKNEIYPYVVNAKLNENDGCVKATFGDLSVVFKIRVACDGSNIGTVRIQEGTLEKWGIDLPTLIQDAYDNLRKNNIIISSIGDVLKKMFSQQLPPEIDQNMQEELEDSNVFYVINDQLGNGGAIYLTSPFYLNYVCDSLRIKSMYIIPSSTEEILILPASGRDNKEAEENLLNMVKEINANELADSIYLADNVYFFDQKDSSYLTRIDNDEKIIFFSDIE